MNFKLLIPSIGFEFCTNVQIIQYPGKLEQNSYIYIYIYICQLLNIITELYTPNYNLILVTEIIEKGFVSHVSCRERSILTTAASSPWTSRLLNLVLNDVQLAELYPISMALVSALVLMNIYNLHVLYVLDQSIDRLMDHFWWSQWNRILVFLQI